jgi:hypothetical protein
MTPEEMQELTTLENERVALVKTKVELETTLRQKRLYEGGVMLGARAYNIRMDTAKRRMGELTVRLIEVNTRLKQLRRLRNEACIAARGLDVQEPVSLIGHAYNMLHKLACEGVEIDPQEQAVIDALGHYLAHVRAEA